MLIKVKKLRDNAALPSRGSAAAAGTTQAPARASAVARANGRWEWELWLIKMLLSIINKC